MLTCHTLALAVIMFSHHFSAYDYNNFNPGLAGQCDHIEIGVYYNSERHMSEYIAYRGDWWKLGIVKGYNGNKWIPGGTVYKDLGKIELNAAPFIETYNGKFHDIGVVVNLAIRWEYKK